MNTTFEGCTIRAKLATLSSLNMHFESITALKRMMHGFQQWRKATQDLQLVEAKIISHWQKKNSRVAFTQWLKYVAKRRERKAVRKQNKLKIKLLKAIMRNSKNYVIV